MGKEVEKYLTIAKLGETLFKDRGSRFLGFAFPVKNVEGVKERLSELKNRYYDARHHCYAYVLGEDHSAIRANDDGEPNHSAGDPILGQINSRNLTNTLVVVVRYFGGTKLGVSGLINAYKTAAFEALQATRIKEVAVKKVIELTYGYDQTNEVMKLVSDFGLDIVDQKFEVSCFLRAEVGIKKKESLNAKVNLLNQTGHSVGIKFIE